MKEAVLNGIIAGFNSVKIEGDFGEKLKAALEPASRNVLSNIFSTEGLKADLEESIESLTNRLNLSDSWQTGIMAGLEAYASGGSLGSSLFSGIGASLSASDNPLGSILNSIIDEFNSVEIEGNFGEKLKAALSNIFSDEGLKADLEKSIESLTNKLNLSSSWQTGIMAGLETYASGGSLGSSLFSGIGTALSVTGNPLGMVVSAIGSIGSSLWGDVDGEEYISQVEEVNSAQDEAIEKLNEYGILANKVSARIKDKASGWSKFWGGHDYKAYHLDEANDNLEELQERLEKVQQTASTIGNGLFSAITETFNYYDLKEAFEESLGQAIQDAIVTKLVETKALDSQIKELSGYISNSLNDGIISNDEANIINYMKENILAGASEIQSVLGELDDLLGFDTNTDVDNSTSFSAGSTSI
ncbi:MAG: hypothetical protein FH762_18625 [Firmicutes bacterium]|nr:hypothetical protein [Bacillota bacterium]